MGNVEAAVVRNVDKRTSRREHRAHFEAAVQRFRAKPFAAPPQRAEETLGRHVRVCVRKRPIFPHELKESEFDVITCLPGRVVVHDARMHPDMVHMHMNHHDFIFDETFGEGASNDEVYASTANQLVMEAANGGNGTVMMYGQTGSGKTYTMTSIYQRAATALFEQAVGARSVTVCFVELLGDACFDMLKQGEPVQLTTAADGSVHPFPCVEVEVRDASELLALIDLATKLRATAATGVHDQSSRSHALCRIFVEAGNDNGSNTDVVEGCLTLVDLAGSEHRVDSAEHNAERRKEGAKINSSLAALKECVRASAAGASFVAFRQNRLTQMLRGCFIGRQHRTTIIACVSPSSKDTEHSLNTIRHACIMDGQGDGKSKQGAHVTGGVVSKELLGAIDVTGIARERKKQAKADPQKGQDDWKKPPPAHQAKKSNTASRQALDRRCMRQLAPGVQSALMAAREDLSQMRQRLRLQRAPPPEAQQEEPAAADSDEEPAVAARPRQPRPKAAGRKAESTSPAAAASFAAADEEEGEDEEDEAYGGSQPSSAPRRGQEDDPDTLFSAAGDNASKAMELFRLFCRGGRATHEWRKNDLRLINTCVLPLLHGPGVQIDWNHPQIALDQLEEIITETPPPSHFMAEAKAAPPARKPRRAGAAGTAAPPVAPSSAPSRSSYERERRAASAAADVCREEEQPRASTSDSGRRRSTPSVLAAGEGAVKARPPLPPGRDPASRSNAGGLPRTPPGPNAYPEHPELPVPARPPPRQGSTRSFDGTGTPMRGPSSARSASSADLGCGPASARSASPTGGAGAPPPVTHHDAIRARRIAMEEQRKQSLQKALEKNKTGMQDPTDEIASLEAQLASNSVSSATKAGLKKRIAAIKAAQLREERAAEKRKQQQRTPAEYEQPAPHAVPAAPTAPSHGCGPSPVANGSPCHRASGGGSPCYAHDEDRGSPFHAREYPPAAGGSYREREREQHVQQPTEFLDRRGSGGRDGFPPSRGGGDAPLPPRSHVQRSSAMGAASAPWGNAFSNEFFDDGSAG